MEHNHNADSIDPAMKITLRTRVVQKCSIDSSLTGAMINLTSRVVENSDGVIVSVSMDSDNCSKQRSVVTEL